MKIDNETLKRIEGHMERLERPPQDADYRERWLLAGFKPSGFDDTWRHEDGRAVTYQQVISSLPE